MRIWVIGRSYPAKKNKMQGSFELEQAKMLAKHGYDVTYIALVFHPIQKIKKWGAASWNEDGVEIRTYSQFYTLARMKFRWKRFQEGKWNSFLYSIEQERGIPDVIHIHYPAMISEPAVILRYKQQGTYVVATEHWSHVLLNTLDSYEKERLNAYVSGADVFLCVGEPLAAMVKKITKTEKELRVIPNIVSNCFIPRYDVLKQKEYCFIAVGRLVPVKQFDRLIRAFALAFRNEKNVRLTIVGGGAKRKLERLAKKSGIADRVEFLGTQTRENVAKVVAGADCLVCSSRLETFGVPVIEAWACGIPVVATDTLGFLSYWQDFLGEIVHWNDENAMADAMKQVVQKKDDYDKRKIADFAKRNFSEDAVFERLDAVYKIGKE